MNVMKDKQQKFESNTRFNLNHLKIMIVESHLKTLLDEVL